MAYSKRKGLSGFIMDILYDMSLDDFCYFNDKNYGVMQHLMNINLQEHADTMRLLGSNAHTAGDSDSMDPTFINDFSYTDGNNYLTFKQAVKSTEGEGINATQKWKIKGKSPYVDYENLYPDDLDYGNRNFTESQKWYAPEPDSILNKTKRLFNEHKINTLISRFATRGDDRNPDIDYNGSKRTYYGESHGRNLLKKGAEENITSKYDYNGYNNPYCRVWTHHYKYNEMYKLMRPFSEVNEHGDYNYTKALFEIHTWPGFDEDQQTTKDGKKILGWKSGQAGWNLSVLDTETTLLNIAPKYGGGGSNNIHTKQCMFSIENLAWRGYDPYSFENALSWEQRGPLGGRIMWFPPYGITFNETTQANWQPNTFIGRGEDVYTYVNTTRTGSLSFLMLVDHPSVLDYAAYGRESGDGTVKDTDIMRYFAGCDDGTITDAVRPTPLTDEVVQKPDIINIEPQKPVPEPEPVEPEIPTPVNREIQFYVFYPNNYSGVYDYPTNSDSHVDAIAYLLNGVGCQKKGDDDIHLMFDEMSSAGDGYEIGGDGITDYATQNAQENLIYGSSKHWSQYGNSKTFTKSNVRKWYYRIDGEYKVPPKSGYNKNTYDQVIYDSDRKLTNVPTNTNYMDTASYSLNASVAAVKKSEIISGDGTDIEDLYSLADIAYVIAKKNNVANIESVLETFSELDSEQLEDLVDLFTNGTVTKIEATGYSNIHGDNASKKVNDDRNTTLSKQRAQTVVNWLKQVGNITCDDVDVDFSASHPVEQESVSSASGKSAKVWRSAKIVLHFKMEKNNTLAKSTADNVNEDGTTDENVFQKYVGYTEAGVVQSGKYAGKKRYKQENPKIKYDELTGTYEEDGTETVYWIEKEDGTLIREDSLADVIDRTNQDDVNGMNYQKFMDTYGGPGNTDVFNTLRYDQEYHFFKKVKMEDPIVWEKLMDKIKYFDPAFHSMTPEGFNGRLTFLHQCTRQGNTVTKSDINGKTANNLAFGRPPFCVLRLGDFYNQMIVIDNINIDYDVSNGIQWDLNPEGAGVQPLLARITISFKFVGGGDLGGPVRRLQNAMTFNYYANARLYDNRADKVKYKWSDKTNGALDYSVDTDASYAHEVKMQD